MNSLATKVETQKLNTSIIDANINLAELNAKLEGFTPIKRVEWALENLPSTHIVSSSFGAQSAVMLHLLNTVAPNIPIVLTDTGYLFKETYEFIEQLRESLKLNLNKKQKGIQKQKEEKKDEKK